MMKRKWYSIRDNTEYEWEWATDEEAAERYRDKLNADYPRSGPFQIVRAEEELAY